MNEWSNQWNNPPPSPQFQQPTPPYAAYPPPPPPAWSYPQPPQQSMPYPGMPPQPMMQPYMAPQMMQSVNVTVAAPRGPGFVTRALYFIFIGSWLGLIWLHIGFALCAGIITLPLGLVMLNRLPQIMTLRQPGQTTKVNVQSQSAMMPGSAPWMPPGTAQTMNINVSIGATQQRNFLLRALYYIFIGCWLGYLWAFAAYVCCATLVLIPVGVMMFDRLPAVLTLRRN